MVTTIKLINPIMMPKTLMMIIRVAFQVVTKGLNSACPKKCVLGPLSETLSNESVALLAFRQSFRQSF